MGWLPPLRALPGDHGPRGTSIARANSRWLTSRTRRGSRPRARSGSASRSWIEPLPASGMRAIPRRSDRRPRAPAWPTFNVAPTIPARKGCGLRRWATGSYTGRLLVAGWCNWQHTSLWIWELGFESLPGSLSVSVTIAERFNGPPGTGNGGYVCGLVATEVGTSAQVSLFLPPPLGIPLTLEKTVPGSVRLLDGDAVIAEGRHATPTVSLPSPPSVQEAREAAERFAGL